MDTLSGDEHTTFVCTHTLPGVQAPLPHAPLPAALLPSRVPRCTRAPAPLSPHLPSLEYQAGAPSAADHSEAEAGSFGGARQHLSPAGRGSRLSPVPLSGPCTAAAGRAECCWRAQGSLAPAVRSPGDSAAAGRGTARDAWMDAGLQSQEPQQGCTLHTGGTVAAAQ